MGTQQRNKINHTSTHHVRWLALGLGLVAVAGLAFGLDAYAHRIFPGVRIGNIAVGGLTKDEALVHLQSQLGQRRVTLTYGQRMWQSTYAELGVVFDLVPPVSQAYSLGRWARMDQWAQTWLLGRTVPLNYTWTNDGLDAALTRIISDIGQLPVNPSVSFVNGSFVVNEAASGLVIDADALQDQLRPAVLLGQNSQVELRPSVSWPLVRAADFAEAVAEATQQLQEPLELREGKINLALPTELRASWYTFSVRTEGRVDLGVDESAIGAYLLTVARDVNTEPQAQEVLVSQSKLEEVRSGKPGRALAISGAVERLASALLSSGTTSVDLPMNDVQPNTLYATAPAPPVTSGKVITVDLTKQHEYVYQDGVLVYSSKISSGLNDWTPTGTFKVYAKTKKQKMSGPDYYVPNVPDILWFKGDYSLHGVYWHNDFGIRPRSHGCVGQPLDAAAWLFDWAEVGTPVVIYKS